MTELNYKELQEKGVFNVPYRAFEFMQSQQAKIDELQARIAIYEKHVKAIKHIHETQFNEHTDTSFILGNLDGFIEYLENDLKGNTP